MRAWSIPEFGRLERVDLPDPEPGPGQVVLCVGAVSLNYRDGMLIAGSYNPRQPLPFVPGSDAVGEVTAVGQGVEGVAIGDRLLPAFNQKWLSGPLVEQARSGSLGSPVSGVFADQICVRADACVPAPEHLDDGEAATLPCAGVTAWRALVVEGGLRAGDVALTLGTGGVSLFAVQVARMCGARVYVTSSSDERLQRAQQLGAEGGVNYRSDASWGKTVAKQTGGVDVVVELGGAGTLDQSLRAVRTGGTVVTIGVLDGVKAELALTKLFMRGIRLQGLFVGSRDDLADLCAALRANPSVRPVIAKRFAFDALPDALAHLERGGAFGKIVVELA